MVNGDFTVDQIENTVEIPRLFAVTEYLDSLIELNTESNRQFLDLT